MPNPTAPPLNQVIRPTTLIEAVRLKSHTGLDLAIASETFQITGSFKFRAAYNLVSNIHNPRVITASSGNFGQAIAYACKLLGKGCTVVMPDNSAQVKVDAVREFGGVADLVRTSEKSRENRVAELAAADPQAYVASAFDDPLVIEGNSSLGRELAAVNPAFDAVLVPIGGGGLSSGIVRGLQEARSKCQVYGVEPLMANDAARSFRSGNLVRFDAEPQTIADGVRTLGLGKHNWEVLSKGLTDVIEVEENTIEEALRLLFQFANLKVEPTGAVALAGALTRPDLFKEKRICCVVSGGNVDPAVYMRILANS